LKEFVYVSLIILLSSCSTISIDSIESYEKIELQKSELSPDSTKITFLKYRVSFVGDSEYKQKILDQVKNIEIVTQSKNYIDYHIEIQINRKSFKNRDVVFGKFIIWNSQQNFIEEIIPISDISSLNIFFSKARGYILEKRVDRDDEVIFKINIGKNRGLKKGSILNIYGFKKRDGYLSQKQRVVSYKIGLVVVSEIIGKDWSWVSLKNKNLADKIFKGYKVVIRKTDFKEYLDDGTFFIKNNKEILENSIRL